MNELLIQLDQLPRKEIALQAIQNSCAISLNSINQCFEMSNVYAPEHLIVASENAEDYLVLIQNAGSVFKSDWWNMTMGICWKWITPMPSVSIKVRGQNSLVW